MSTPIIPALVLFLAAPALAQDRSLINDRARNSVWLLDDRNANGRIDEPGEVRLFFDASNASGIIGPSNPTCLAVRWDALAVMGDQGHGAVFLLQDLNGDGDAQDAGEARIGADQTNASGMSLAFPTGAGFDSLGVLHIVNAGNAFGPDAVYRFQDLDGDGTFQGPGEITVFIGEPVFGPGNGPWSPREIVFLPTAVVTAGYLRDSSSGFRGVYWFIDRDFNGRADDPGEFGVFFDGSNGSGVVVSSGFSIELDQVNPGSLYMLQVASGGVDQVYRLTDLNGNGDAQDPGEAVLVFETAEPGFTSIDLLSLPDGRLLVTDNSSKRLIVLTDLDGDGRFMSPGEREDYFANAQGIVGDIRQIAALPGAGCYADCDGSGSLDFFDFLCFQNAFLAGEPYADCDGSGVLDFFDFLCFQNEFLAGCP
jgi:hypothetical protein